LPALRHLVIRRAGSIADLAMIKSWPALRVVELPDTDAAGLAAAAALLPGVDIIGPN
jgi:hypothetical protein